MKIIDLRSDTVTKPSDEMRKAMADAEVGDDVYGEDPTVNRLESMAAETIGKEAALFVTSGTQGNLLALLSHCRPGDEYIAGQAAHTYKYEGGGGALFGGIQPQPLDFEKDGTLDLDKVRKAIKPADIHFARTRLLCLENTVSGKVLPLSYVREVSDFARNCRLKTHLDGARIFNASVKLGVPVTDISRHFDSVSFCLSKGLGAPVGSVLCGSAELIEEARWWRKRLGGGMRQAGILAAAGIYALRHNIGRLVTDHENAALLADGLKGIERLAIHENDVQTNMVFATLRASDVNGLAEFMKDHGVLVSAGEKTRMVTHLDVNQSDIKKVVRLFADYYSNR